jgi:hypothetical protein
MKVGILMVPQACRFPATRSGLTLETPIDKPLASGGYETVEDVLRRALEAQDAEESWTGEERGVLSAHIEEGYRQAERGVLIDGAQARGEIQAMKEDWRSSRR